MMVLKALTGIRLLALLSLALVTSCASAQVTFTSVPDKAEVYLRKLGTGQPKRVGLTPFTLKGAEIDLQNEGTGPYFVEFRKDGHLPMHAIVTDLAGTDLTVSAELPATNGLEDEDRLNRLIDGMFEAQRLSYVKRYDDALKLLKDLEKDNPRIAAVFEIEGGIYFMQKKYKEARDSYGLSASLNPKNTFVVKMRAKLDDKLGKGRP